MANRGTPDRTPQPPAYWAYHTPVRCPACNMTYRPPYAATPYRQIEQGGETPDGQPYTHVAWRFVHCHLCGQYLSVRVLENHRRRGRPRQLK